MVQHLETTGIGEIAVMPLPMEKVNFLAVCLSVEHSIFSEMVSGSFPFERATEKAVGVLLGGRLFFLCDEENNLVVVTRGDDTASDSVKTCVAPKLGQRLAGVTGALCDLGKSNMHNNRSVNS